MQAFAEALPDGGRLLGLDIGTKTVGMALCDSHWTFATAAETIERRKFSKDLERIKTVIAEQHIVGIVAGLPLNLDRLACRSCCGTNGGARRRLPAI